MTQDYLQRFQALTRKQADPELIRRWEWDARFNADKNIKNELANAKRQTHGHGIAEVQGPIQPAQTRTRIGAQRRSQHSGQPVCRIDHAGGLGQGLRRVLRHRVQPAERR